jgi:hypothetical protein
MDSTAIIAQLDAILSAPQVDAASMQIFDAIALSAKHDIQLRSLAQYMAENMPLELTIDISSNNATTVLNIGGKNYATIVVDKTTDTGTVTVTFASRTIWNAKAYAYVNSVKQSIACTLSDNTITMTGISSVSASSITLKFY